MMAGDTNACVTVQCNVTVFVHMSIDVVMYYDATG